MTDVKKAADPEHGRPKARGAWVPLVAHTKTWTVWLAHAPTVTAKRVVVGEVEVEIEREGSRPNVSVIAITLNGLDVRAHIDCTKKTEQQRKHKRFPAPLDADKWASKPCEKTVAHEVMSWARLA